MYRPTLDPLHQALINILGNGGYSPALRPPVGFAPAPRPIFTGPPKPPVSVSPHPIFMGGPQPPVGGYPPVAVPLGTSSADQPPVSVHPFVRFNPRIL